MDDSYLEPHFSEPYNTWKTDPSPKNADVILKAVNPVITAALKSYAGGMSTSPTLRSKAKIIALDAINKYDPMKSKLQTHLMFQLQGLRRHTAKEQQILSVPEKVALDALHLREAENILSDKLGRDPSTMELSEHLMLSPKRIEYIRRARPSYSEGVFQKSTEEGESTWTPPIQEKGNAFHWHEFVYHDLPPVDQLIMEHTLGMHGRKVLSNQDLSKKLKISPGAVSQRKARIQSKLDMREELGVI